MALSLGSYGGSRWEGLVVRMGGGKRTFPGGVTKWQWKRLQQQKQRMREKAWLLRERRIYEKRKRQEMMSAITVLEKPWEQQPFPGRMPMADDQLSALADRFRKPGALDLWNYKDGPSRNQGEDEEEFFSVEEQIDKNRVDQRPFLPTCISGIDQPVEPANSFANSQGGRRFLQLQQRRSLLKSTPPVLPEYRERRHRFQREQTWDLES